MKRFLSIVLAVGMCVALSATAFAQIFSPVSLRFSHIGTFNGNMTISGGTASVSGSVRINSGDACEIVATIEQEVDGSWQEVKTFTVSADDTSVSINKRWALYKGYNYRCVFQFNAYEGGVLAESYEAITNEKWC